MMLSTRLAVAMVALVTVTAAAVGSLTYRNIEAVVLPRALARIDAQVRLLAIELEAAVRGARADAIGFRSAVAVDGIVRATLAGGSDRGDGITAAQWIERLATRFVAELEAKPHYLQFRVIGAADGGREMLRVERSQPEGPIRVVPAGELQRKGDRDYFQRAIGLPPGGVDVSPVELNREQGAIEAPHVPVLRAATAVHAPDGRPFGVVVINVDLRPAFDRIRAATQPGWRIYVVDDDGDYLVHPDRGREFAFEFGRPDRVQDDFPGIAPLIGRADGEPQVLVDRAGARFGVGIDWVRLAGGPRVGVIEAVPEAQIAAAMMAVRDSSLVAGIAAVLVAIGLAIVLARSLTRPLVQMTAAVEGFGHDRPAAVPVTANGEIGVLARAFERMRAEVGEKTAALTREIAERRRIFETSVDLILVVGRRGEFLRVSPSCETILGYRPDEMEGHVGTEFLYAEDLDPTRDEMRQARLGHSTRNFDCRYVHKDGRVVPLAWTGVWSEPEQRHYFIGRDMTERVKLEQQLRQSQKMDAVGQLTGGVAHDFNNILTVITGTIDILADAVADRPKLAAIVTMIDQAAQRGADLTQQLLAVARKQPLAPRATDINALVDDTARLLRPTLGELIEIEAALEDGVAPALVDPTQLSTALINLAINARDAMPDGGKLMLETGNVVLDESYVSTNPDVRPGPYVLIAVSDTGAGIPAPIRDKVLEPFFTTKEVGKGTGLGLSMVYGFAKQTGGHLRIYSEEGLGTTIRLYLPQASDGQAAAATTPSSTAAAGGSETVLVVEDDRMVRDYVVAQLASLGYTPLVAADGAAALQLADAGAAFDLLFTDVIMPGGLNGRQLAEEIGRRRPGTKVLYTSGYTENAIVHHGRLDPGVALLAKPYRKTDLARKIREVLEGVG